MEIEIKNDEYGGFYETYISYSNKLDLFNLLRLNEGEMTILLNTLSEEEAEFRYQPGKWSIKEVIGHMTDTERIFCYRALAIARGEIKPIPGYDHDRYVEMANFDRFTMEDLKNQYRITRNATITLFSSFSENELRRTGIVNDSPFSVRAIGYVIAGHEMHHLHILSERYLPGMGIE